MLILEAFKLSTEDKLLLKPGDHYGRFFVN